MATDNWLSTLSMVADATGPAGLLLNSATFLPLSLARVQRRAISSVQRRDPFRHMEEARAVLSSFALGWDFQVSDAEAPLHLIMEALADPGSVQVSGGGHTGEIRTSKDARRFNATALGVDGTTLGLEGGLLRDCMLSMERRTLVRVATAWDFWKLNTEPLDLAPLTPAQTGYATPDEIVVRIDGVAGTVFAGSLSFGREAGPAGFNDEGVASAWDGNLTPDLVGRLVLRMDTDDFYEALQETFHAALEIEIPTPGKTFTISVPQCAMQVPEKRAAGVETYEHVLELVACKLPASPLLTFTLA